MKISEFIIIFHSTILYNNRRIFHAYIPYIFLQVENKKKKGYPRQKILMRKYALKGEVQKQTIKSSIKTHQPNEKKSLQAGRTIRITSCHTRLFLLINVFSLLNHYNYTLHLLLTLLTNNRDTIFLQTKYSLIFRTKYFSLVHPPTTLNILQLYTTSQIPITARQFFSHNLKSTKKPTNEHVTSLESI